MLPAPPPPPDVAPPSTAETPSHRIVLALVLAFGLMALSSVFFGLFRAYWLTNNRGYLHLNYERWNLVQTGVYVAYLALLVAGAFDLFRRTTGTAGVGGRLVLGATLAMVLFAVVQHYMIDVYRRDDGSNLDNYLAVMKWIDRAQTVCWYALCAGIVVAGWHVRRVRLLAGPLLAVLLVAVPLEFYSEPLYKLLAGTGHFYRGAIVNGFVDVALAALAIAILHASPPPVDTLGFERGGRGLDRVALGLFVQVWVLLISVMLILMMFGSRGSGGEGIAKLYAIGAPLVIVIAVLITISGVLGAAGMHAPGAPRLSLYAAAVGFTISFTITAIQTLILFKALDGFDGIGASDRADQLALAQALPIFKPVLGLVTLVALGLGLHGLGHMLADRELEGRAGRAIGVVVICQLIGIVIPYAMLDAPNVGPGDVVFALVAVAATGAISLVILARTCRALASGLRARHDLPVANLFA